MVEKGRTYDGGVLREAKRHDLCGFIICPNSLQKVSKSDLKLVTVEIFAAKAKMLSSANKRCEIGGPNLVNFKGWFF